MKLYCALRKMQRGCDLFIGETPHEAAKHFLFPAGKLDVTADGMASLEKPFRFFGEAFQRVVFGRYYYHVIARRMAEDHAVHRQQTGGMVHGKPPIPSCLHLKMGPSGAFLVEVIEIAGNKF